MQIASRSSPQQGSAKSCKCTEALCFLFDSVKLLLELVERPGNTVWKLRPGIDLLGGFDFLDSETMSLCTVEAKLLRSDNHPCHPALLREFKPQKKPMHDHVCLVLLWSRALMDWIDCRSKVEKTVSSQS